MRTVQQRQIHQHALQHCENASVIVCCRCYCSRIAGLCLPCPCDLSVNKHSSLLLVQTKLPCAIMPLPFHCLHTGMLLYQLVGCAFIGGGAHQ